MIRKAKKFFYSLTTIILAFSIFTSVGLPSLSFKPKVVSEAATGTTTAYLKINGEKKNATQITVNGFGNYEIAYNVDVDEVEQIALVIDNGENYAPGAKIRVWDWLVDDEPVAQTTVSNGERIIRTGSLTNKGYTYGDGNDTIFNLYDDYVIDETPGANRRSYDNMLNGKYNCIDPLKYYGAEKIGVEFAYVDADSSADIAYSLVTGIISGSWNGTDFPYVDSQYNTQVARVTGAGTYTVRGKLDSLTDKFIFIGARLQDGENTFDGAAFNYTSVKLYPSLDFTGTPTEALKKNFENETIPAYCEGYNENWDGVPHRRFLVANTYGWSEPNVVTGVDGHDSNVILGPVNSADNGSGMLVDKAYGSFEFTFEVVPIEIGEPVDAYLEYIDGNQNGGFVAGLGSSTAEAIPAVVDRPGIYTARVEYPNDREAGQGVYMMRIRLLGGETFYEGWKISIRSITINDSVTIDFSTSLQRGMIDNPAYDAQNPDSDIPPMIEDMEDIELFLRQKTYSLDGKDMICDIYDTSVFPDTIKGARSSDNSAAVSATHMIFADISPDDFKAIFGVDKTDDGLLGLFNDVVSLEVSFKLTKSAPVVPVAFNAKEHLENSQHSFYMGLQADESWIFRDGWSDAMNGLYGANTLKTQDANRTNVSFNHLSSYYPEEEGGRNHGGSFSDLSGVKLNKEATTYSVKLDIGLDDFGFSNAGTGAAFSGLNLLYVSTTIWYEAYQQGMVHVSNVRLIVDGNEKTLSGHGGAGFLIGSQSDGRAKKDGNTGPANQGNFEYMTIEVINTYSSPANNLLNAPQSSIEILFDINYGLGPVPVLNWIGGSEGMVTEGKVKTPIEYKFEVENATEIVVQYTEPGSSKAVVLQPDVDGKYIFTPTKSGKYTLTVTASNGNGASEVVRSIEVQKKGKGCRGSVTVASTIMLFASALIVVSKRRI